RTRLEKATGPLETAGGSADARRPGDGLLDAVVLAQAGLARLGYDAHITEVLPIELSLPAAGQAALAIETVDASAAAAICAQLEEVRSSQAVRAERAVLARLQGGCTLPVAAHAVHEGDTLYLRALLGGPAGEGPISLTGGEAQSITLLRAEARGPASDPLTLGTLVAERLLEAGGAPLLERSRLGAAGLPAPQRSRS
ncbi:MAG: hypothetical protein JST92_20915, partial [Deltaproteobacteria bacterium]|nr:hypothetical protein [Deltaproteobacteria bacterium]